MYEKSEKMEEVEKIEIIQEEAIEEVENEISEELKEMEEEVEKSEESEESEATEELEETSSEKKIKKHTKARNLVEKAKNIVKEADEETEACKLLLLGGLKEYEEAKSALKLGGFDACASLLEKVGHQIKTDSSTQKKEPVFEPKEALPPMTVKDVSSGKVTGFVYALLGGAVTAVGLVYLATEKLGITLDISKVPSPDISASIASWFSTAVGLNPDTYIGTVILGLVVFLVMGIIYVSHVSFKASKNLHFAVKQFVEAELYAEKKGNCKVEMEKVDEHMKDTIETLKAYEVLFNEQKGKLQRILYFEGEKEKGAEYHDKSFLEIRDTKELIRTIRDLMDIPMLEEGKLSDKSTLFLHSAKNKIDKILERLY